MALDPVFASFTAQLDGLFLDQVPALVQAGLSYARNPLRAALGLYVVVHCFNMILGDGSGRAVGWAVARAFVVATAMQAPYYTQYVSEAFLTRLPAELAGALSGRPIVAGAAEQFDILRSGMANLKAVILMAAPDFGQMDERIAAHVFDAGGFVGIGLMWFQWYMPRALTGIVLCVGPFLVPLWLFEASRGFAMAFAAKLVSLLALSVGASVIVSILLRVIDRVAAPINAATGSNVDVLIGKLAAVAALMWFGAFLMRSLPRALAFEGVTTAAATSLTANTAAALAAPVTAIRRLAAR